MAFSIPFLFILVFSLTVTTSAKNIDIDIDEHLNTTTPLFTPYNSKDPTDLTCIERWAAIGDSFTAGIGSGNLYSNRKEDVKCSRYDRSYPAILERQFPSSVRDFQYLACSGDRTPSIYEQAVALEDDLDLVVLTAGGNDLCLADIISRCIFLPYRGESKCQEVLDTAQQNIDTILKPNIHQVLSALKPKMRKNGVVVYTMYAQHFDTTNNDCVDKQNWAFPSFGFTEGLKLTIDRRQKFNALVDKINLAILSVVNEFRNDASLKFSITTADWNPWPRFAVKGQFCSPESTGMYPDPAQPDLHFFRQNVQRRSHSHDEFKQDIPSVDGDHGSLIVNQTKLAEELNIENSTLYRSVNPPAEALHKLDPRAPQPPKCPGDDSSLDFGWGLPDRWGKFFHPNELGHVTIASFVLEAIIAERALILGAAHPLCHAADEFRCKTDADTHKRYVSSDLLNKNYKTYCLYVVPPSPFKNWHDERVFHEGTAEAHKFSISLSNDAMGFSQKECEHAFERIINACQDKTIDNPMNWKFGGRWTRGSYTFEISPVGSERPWPPIREVTGKCKGSYKFLFDHYTIEGAGWSTWDNGRDTLVPSIKKCITAGGLTKFKMQYYDKPSKDGMEWKASFNTPIWTRGGCFKNNKVQKNAGGYTYGCGGSGSKSRLVFWDANLLFESVSFLGCCLLSVPCTHRTLVL